MNELKVESILIQDEAEMAVFAAHLAKPLGKGDCILLSGDLGAGKTVFARSIIRALCGAGLEVVSPTFMLLQEYDVLPEHGGFLLWHYDLYRLKHADELLELGLEQAEEALVLVEWPQMAEGWAWPDNRLEVEIVSVPERANSRRVLVSASGDMLGKMESLISAWKAHH